MVIRTLLSNAPCDRLDAEVLLSHVLGIPREKLLFHFNEAVSSKDAALFSAFCDKRAEGRPLAYLLQSREFYSLPFKVTPDTLIPRPDTEILVEWACTHAAGQRVLDLCCGSGCIGIAIAKNADISALTLADISESALRVAAENAKLHQVAAMMQKIDILNEPLSGTYDMIVSNPPYIETDVIQTLAPDVREYEPISALDGGADGLLFYPVIIEKSAKALSFGGFLGLEIGYSQASAVMEWMKKYFSNVGVLRDYGGNDRVLYGQKLE